MVYTFCTLFDKNYVYRGLALYESLEREAGNFTLHILCLDDETYDTLSRLQLPKVVLVRLQSVETEAVLRAKGNRNKVEYYWTLASVFTYYVAEASKASSVAYIDSDIYFFASPATLYEELGESSVLIIKHNYPPRLAYLEARSGIYNVGVVIFKCDAVGLKCLGDWRSNCLAWCYNRSEQGKFGDQMYLDSWPARYKGVRVLAHPGGGVAPWNVDQFTVGEEGGRVYVAPGQPLLFYHFHSLKMLSAHRFVHYSFFYSISASAERLIYAPYSASLQRQIEKVQTVSPAFSYGLHEEYPLLNKLKDIAKRVFIRIVFFYK